MVMRYGHNLRIPEVTQAIFYVVVLNNAAELELSSRIAMDCMMSVLWELNWAVIEFWLWGIEERLRKVQIPILLT